MTRQLTPIVLVAYDGSTPAAPAPTLDPISVAQYEDGEVPYIARRANGAALDLSDWSVVLTVRRTYYSPDPPPISRAPVPSSISAGVFPIGAADTALMVVDPIEGYQVDVEGTDPSGKRWQLRPPGNFFVTETEGLPDAPVTLPISYPPAGQGPQGPGFRWRGLYDAGTTYAIDDVVRFVVGTAAPTFVATAITTGNAPTNTAFWDPFTMGGTGAQGDVGPQPPLSSDDPEPVGVAAPGTSTDASPSDHVHPTNGLITMGPTSVWADIQAQIDAVPGGGATVMVCNFYAPDQPAGAYEIPADAEVRINACRFVSGSGFGLIRMKAGAKLLPDAGGFVDPHLDGVILITEAAVTDPGTKLFLLAPHGGGIWNVSDAEASFPACPEAYINATGQIPPYYVAAPLLAIGSQPVVEVAAAGTLAVIGAGALQCGAGSIGTGAGADVAFELDEYAAYYFVDPLTGPGSLSLDVFPIKLADSTRTSAGPVGTTMRVAATRQLVVSDGATAKHAVELIPTTLKTAGYSPSAGELVLFSLAGGPFTFPLPASPAPGDKIGLAHRNAEPVNALTLDGNGELINGAATQVLSGEWFFATLTFTATTGWILS